MKVFIVGASGLALGFISSALHAQTVTDAHPESLDEVVVVANRAPQPLSKVGSSVTVLNEATIRESQVLQIADLLAQTPGISFDRNGGLGSLTSIYIRGAESGQTMVLIDGVQITDPSAQDNSYDFGNLYARDITRIEILRGSHSVLYGSQAIGGVIDIHTRAPTADLEGNLEAEAGSRSSGLLAAGAGGTVGNLGWRLAGQHFQTAGIADFDKNFGGTTLDRSKNDSFSGRADYALGADWSLDLRSYYTSSRIRFDGYDTPTGVLGNDLEYGTTNQSISYAGVNGASFDGRLKQRLAAQYTETNRGNFDPALPSPTETFSGVGRNRRLEYQGTLGLLADQQLVFGAQTERASISTDTPAYDVGPGLFRSNQRTNSVYAELTSTLLSSLTLTVGGRYDDHEAFGSHTSGQASAAWALNDGNTILRSSFGQGFKAPSLYQLYSSYGNRDLRPEQANSWDAGVEQRAWNQKVAVQATYFHRDSHDLINFFDCSTPSPLCATEPFGYYANVTESKAKGMELQGVFVIAPTWQLRSNYTYLTVEDRSPGATTFGRELPRRPKDLANLSLNYCPSTPLTGTAAVRYAGRSFEDAANQIRLAPYAVLDLRVGYTLSAHYEVYGRVENATDKQYETAYQYGTLGRGFFVGLRATL